MPPKKKQPEPLEEVVYRPPSDDALRAFGFGIWGAEPMSMPAARAGCSGGSGGVWLYPGYKGSPKIEIILLSHGWFTCGKPGPNPEPAKKYRAANGHELLAILHECGYPTAQQSKELERAEKAKQEEDLAREIAEEEERLKKWERDCIWAKSNGKQTPMKPKFKHI
jgi:hypothetical protein